jgi:hypothetical protein
MTPLLHFPEQPVQLELLLQVPQGLFDVLVLDPYLHDLPPPPPYPPPRFPPLPPPDPERSVFGLASFTVIVRSMNVVPFMEVIALAASSSDAISTKPKPLDLPFVWSTISVADVTSPIFENASRKSSSWVLYDKFPTYNFFAMLPPP